MIEVNKLIPRVYSQSRDFGVFMGLMQVVLNEIDQKSRILEKLPIESILPRGLSSYEQLREYFRLMLKNKGTIYSILLAVTLSGGGIFKLDEESEELSNLTGFENIDYIERLVEEDPDDESKKKYLYVYSGNSYKKIDVDGNSAILFYDDHTDGICKLVINLKDPSNFNRDLFDKLCYYLKPVNTVIILKIAN